jgi:hypothetical protein
MSDEFRILIEPMTSAGEAQAGRYWIQVLESPAGTTSPVGSTLDVRDREFQAELAEVRGVSPGRPALEAFGRRLFDAVFTGPVLNRWTRSRGRTEAGGRNLSLRLVIEDRELASLPWELLWDSENGEHPALAPGLGASRALRNDQGDAPQPSEGTLRVLVVVASPPNLQAIEEGEVLRLLEAF